MSPLPEDSIILSPIGDIDPGIVAWIAKEIPRIFDFPVIVTALLTHVQFAFDADRNQYNSTEILKKLSASAPREALKVIGITDVDLFIPILTHVFGEAQLGGPACIISLFRLGEDLAFVADHPVYRCRVVKEAVHELGHCFDLRHCKDPSCIMNYGRSIRDVDRRSDRLCRYCRVLLSDALKRMGKTPGNDPAGGTEKI